MTKFKILIVSLLLATITFSGNAQNIELIPYMNYQFGGRVQFYDGEMKFNDSENYGIAMVIDLPLQDMGIQLEYFRQATTMDLRWYRQVGPEAKRYEVAMDWYQLGFMRKFGYSDELVPYGGISLGAVNFRPYTNEVESKLKFAMTGQLGLKYYLNDRLGIRLQVRMLMPIQWGGFGFYFGGGGGGTTVSAGSSIIQGDIGGGIVLRLGKGE